MRDIPRLRLAVMLCSLFTFVFVENAAAQCSAVIRTELLDHESIVKIHMEASNSCPAVGHIEIGDLDSDGHYTPEASCNNPPGVPCVKEYTFALACRPEGTYPAGMGATCSVPGPNNTCVQASQGEFTTYNVSRSGSISANVSGFPYLDSFHSTVINFNAHAQWSGAERAQLVWEAYWLPTKTRAGFKFIENGSIDANGNANSNRIGLYQDLSDSPTLGEVRLWICNKEVVDYFAVDTNECCPGCSCPGGPFSTWNGNMRYAEVDPVPAIGPMRMTRTYDSTNGVSGWFGSGWSSVLDEWLRTLGEGDGSTTVVVTTSDYNQRVFHGASSFTQAWPKDSKRGTLRLDGSGGYVYREYGGDVEHYFSMPAGRLYKLRQVPTGREVSIVYDNNGLITHLTDSWGAVGWTVTEDASRRISSIAVDGTPIIWTYGYDSAGRLHTVSQSNAVWRTYNYNGPLTEVRDAAGHLVEGHSYGTNGTTSSLGQTDDITNVEYRIGNNGDPVWGTRLTYANGTQAMYYNKQVAGSPRIDHIDGGCGSCTNRNAVFAYDNRGHLFREQDARGYITERTFDGRDRMITETTALVPTGCDPETDSLNCRQVGTLDTVPLSPTSASLSRNYTYGDDPWYDRPLSITTVSVVNPNGSRVETMTYDLQTGEWLTRSISGWTGSPASPQQEQHTTTAALYDGTEGAAFDPGGAFNPAWLTLPQPRLRKSLDGPRNDVADVTRWVYYPVDVAVPPFLRARVAAVRDAAGNTTRFETYDAFGNPGRTVDPNGVATEFSYNGAGQLLSSTLKGVSGCDTAADALCATDLVISRTYESTFGSVASETRPNGATTTYEYDGRGRLTALVRPVSGSLSERMECDYDPASGRKSAERYLSGHPGAWTLARSEAYGYDTNGRLTSINHPDATSVVYTYDAANNLSSVKDENHSSPNTTYKYDPLNRLVRVTQTLSTAPGGTIATQYAYDLHGNLVSVTDPNGNVTAYGYDDFARMEKQTSPVTGVTTYIYDPAGNLILTTDANGATTSRSYDAISRVVSATATRNGTTESVNYTYDQDLCGVGNGVNRLTSMTDPTGTTAYCYDRRGLLTNDNSVSYQYDANGNRSRINHPSGQIVSYSFDLTDRPMTATANDAPIVSAAAYLPFGPLTQLTFGNGTSKLMTFDNRYRPLTNRLNSPAGTIAQYSYANDAAGNITQIHDAVDATYNRDFAYDDLNRLVTANSGSSLWGSGGYQYDSMGNVTSLHLGSRVLNFSYVGTTPKLQGMSYDAAGNELWGDPGDTAYSPRNLLARMGFCLGSQGSCVNYDYDGRGVRVHTSAQSSSPYLQERYSTYSPELQLLEQSEIVPGFSFFSPTTITTTDYVRFGGLPVAQLTTTTSGFEIGGGGGDFDLRFTFTDHLGTPILQTDSTASVVWRAEYEPYGSVYAYREGSSDDQQVLRLPGQEAERWNSDLSYNIFRWYNSAWGRYTQADPLGVAYSTINPFTYVSANPLLFKDPSGLVQIKQGTERLGGEFGGGGHYSLAFGKVFTNGKCVGCGNDWHIELSLYFIHGYYCSGPGSCDIELLHANIASAFVAKAAQQWRKYEEVKYTDKALCEAMARFYADNLKKGITDDSYWPDALKRQLYEAQRNYEDTHHGWPCGWIPGLCSY